MEDFAKTHALPNVCFPPYVPREQLAAELAKADVHLASQSPAFTGLVVPSKFYGTLAIGRAAAVVAPEDAEIARVVRESDCGRVFTPDAAGGEALAEWLRALAGDREKVARLGERARQAHEKQHRPSLRLAQWVELLEGRL